MNDLLIFAFVLLLIFAFIYDNRNHPGAWHDDTKEDHHH